MLASIRSPRWVGSAAHSGALAVWIPMSESDDTNHTNQTPSRGKTNWLGRADRRWWGREVGAHKWSARISILSLPGTIQVISNAPPPTMASHLTSALEEARKQYAAEHPKSAEAHRFAQECMPGGSTRSSIFVHPFPIHVARGEGNRLTDVDGNVYTDL